MRNKEIRQFTLCFALITAFSVMIGLIIQPSAALAALLSAAAFGAAFFVFTRARYRALTRLTEQIDHVLHDDKRLYISEFREGELSILENEIAKMTLRIREQNKALQADKCHLAEALADIAHQLRTPLTSANLILSLLEDTSDMKQQQALLRETEQLFAQMDWLLTALLKLSRLDAGIVIFQNQQVAVTTIIASALRPLLIPFDLHDITVQSHIPPEATLYCDVGWLSEALQNILKNCMASIGYTGQIAILCTDTPLFTEIVIHDSGAGFAPEDLPHLFDRFYRGKKSASSGYGIGLALCRTIITHQGGMIIAKNHHQGGAVFTLRFPK